MPGLSRYFNKKFFVLVNYSSEDGNNEGNDITSFIKYMLGRILAAYRDFEERVILVDGKASAIDLVRNAVNNAIGKFTKTDIMELVSFVGKTSVENSLKALTDGGVMEKGRKREGYFLF